MEDVIISSFQLGFCPIYLKCWKRSHRDSLLLTTVESVPASLGSEPRAGTGGMSSWLSSGCHTPPSALVQDPRPPASRVTWKPAPGGDVPYCPCVPDQL